MKNIFKQGCKDNLSTVALPAIGTGNLKIPHDIVADIMYDEVEIFSKQNPRTLKDIHFVVYDKDQDSIKVSRFILKHYGMIQQYAVIW